MPFKRRYSPAMIALGVGTIFIAAAVAIAVIGSRGLIASSGQSPVEASRSGPKAVVDRTPWDLGIIDSPEEFDHKFVIRNEGSAPLQLRQGPSECKCTVSELPSEPVPPGGSAEIRVNFSEASKKDTLKPGPFCEGIYVVTNDPEHEAIELKVTATVRRRLVAEPSPLVFILKWSDLAKEEKHSAQTWIYSQRWEQFQLEAKNPSLAGLKWQIEAATPQRLQELQARSGYRVEVTLPPDMPDGEFRETLEFSAEPADAGEQSRALKLDIQGRIHGRLVFSGPKVSSNQLSGNQVLLLGALSAGAPIHERVLMKVNVEPRTLTVQQIETEPKFIRAQVEPYNSESAAIGLYRIEIEIPADAPSGNFTGEHHGVIHLKTDHPKLALIELPVDFAVVEEHRTK